MNAILPVAVEGLAVHLGGSRILDDVALSVSSGESVAFLGANGSGKSTLVRAILGIVPASAGSVELFGESIAARRSVPWSRIGYVPQRVTASSGVPATALEVVRSGLLGRGRLWADVGPRAKRKALAALSAVGLEDRARDHVQVFSGGQAQRVLIARALVREPDLLFLDEPLAGIDRDSRRALDPLRASRARHDVGHRASRDGRIGTDRRAGRRVGGRARRSRRRASPAASRPRPS